MKRSELLPTACKKWTFVEFSENVTESDPHHISIDKQKRGLEKTLTLMRLKTSWHHEQKRWQTYIYLEEHFANRTGEEFSVAN